MRPLPLIIILILFPLFTAYSQVSDSSITGSDQKSSSTKLALAYYKIKFTKEQRKQLAQVNLELMLHVDSEGNLTLEDVKGTTDEAIIDSLKRTTRLAPKFPPRIVNGAKEEAIYFMEFQYPKRTISQGAFTPFNSLGYKRYALDDFEFIRKSGRRMDMVFGGTSNGFLGQAGNHLGVGGGMKIDFMFTGKKGYGLGFITSFYGNKLKKEYQLNTSREQYSTPPTMVMGASLSKFIAQQERREFTLQVDICYAIQNLTARLTETDQGWIQLQGFSPGVVANYLIKIGKDHPDYYYGSPFLRNNYINLHGAIRPVFYNLKQASGTLVEFGISYRMGLHQIREYKLKPEAVE